MRSVRKVTDDRNRELFETKPIPKALLSLAVPTIISQLVVMAYNMADTFFIGMTDDPYKIAAASMTYVLFFMLNAIANLFGIGGGSLISRLLGEKKGAEARGVCSFSVWGTGIITAVYSILCLVFMEPVLRLIGASDNTVGYASSYLLWVVIIGGIPASLSMAMSHVLRSEGHGGPAGIGLTIGSVLNIALDPLFMFVIFPDGMEVTGAAVATALSNVVSLVYYLVVMLRLGPGSVLTLDVRRFGDGLRRAKEVFYVGVPSAVNTVLVSVSIMVLNALASRYGDIPVAAIGIVKKVDMLPHNVGTGLCQGMIPLVAYNYAAKNFDRMKKAINLARWLGVALAALCVITFETLGRPISSLFIREEETLGMTASFLRVICLANPLTVCNFHMTYTLQGMGKGRESLLLSACRQGISLIPLYFLFNALFGLYGIVWAPLVAEAITFVIAMVLYRVTMKKVTGESLRA